MKVFIVIAAFNEDKVIRGVITDLKAYGYNNLIVVDDGSEDKTVAEARKENVTIIKHIINKGQGAALKTGIEYAITQGANIMVTFDGDGQHCAYDLENLIKPIIYEGYDIALGSRFLLNNSNVPPVRKLFLKGGILIHRILYGIQLTDAHNGLRAMSRLAAKKITLSSTGMEHASEIIEEVQKKKLKHIEIPVTIKYTEYSKSRGQSSWNAFKILSKMLIKKFLRR